ncbi:alpha/beta fold hydrolase [Paludibacter jiangxiensis]|nr:alpha/beta hydrolase [Paludibacter jiangxiensis]
MKPFSFCLIVFLCVLTPSISAQINYGNNPAAGKYLTTRGIKLYYETYGRGEPLLMIHGNGGSISGFSNQIPFFAQKYKVIAVDSRAQGKSADACDSLSFEMMADDFNALLDSMHISSCRVLGWSDGGINALLMAIRHPQKVKMLASTGANLIPDSTVFVPHAYREWMNDYLRSGKETQTPKLKNQRKLMALDLFQPHITTAQLQTIKCPSLIIGGDHDLIVPSHTLEIANAIPGAFCWIIPDSGHATLIQHKKQFNEVVNAFFNRQIHGK